MYNPRVILITCMSNSNRSYSARANNHSLVQRNYIAIMLISVALTAHYYIQQEIDGVYSKLNTNITEFIRHFATRALLQIE